MASDPKLAARVLVLEHTMARMKAAMARDGIKLDNEPMLPGSARVIDSFADRLRDLKSRRRG